MKHWFKLLFKLGIIRLFGRHYVIGSLQFKNIVKALKVDSPNARKKALEITKDSPTPNDKLYMIHKWVRQNIVWVSDKSKFGWWDHWQKPDEVLKRREGDCEDIARLVYCMCDTVGLSGLCMVGSDMTGGQQHYYISALGNIVDPIYFTQLRALRGDIKEVLIIWDKEGIIKK